MPIGTRVGVSWMGGVDGDCWFCRHGMENLCDRPVFTGYSVNGGYAEYAAVRADFTIPLSAGSTIPCRAATMRGYHRLPQPPCCRSRARGARRSLRLWEFGPLAIRVLHSWDCEIYVVTRGEANRAAAESLGATWVGDEDAKPSRELIAPSPSHPAERSS